MSWATLYRLALRVLPAALRAKHGPAMEALFVRQQEKARREGRIRGVVAGVAGISDLVARGAYERLRRRRSRDRDPRAAFSEGTRGMDALRDDVRHAFNALRKAPRFSAAVILILALGMGANTAIFTVVDAVLFRSLPFPDAGRVVNLAWASTGYLQSGLSPVQFEYWRDRASAPEAVATWRGFLGRVDDGGELSSIRALRVSPDFLSVVGWAPEIGRAFAESEYVADGPRVAIVSHAVWQSHLGGTTAAVGSSLRLNEEPYTVVGVLPEAFAFPYEDESIGVLVPLALAVDPDDEGRNWPAIARLRDGVSMREARTEISALTAPFQAAYPHQVYEGEHGMELATFGELYAQDASKPLWVLMGAVALVLLIACANVANLFLARTAQRRGEIALRGALGATRVRIARLVLAESLMVACVAGALGLPLAGWGARALVALTPSDVPRMDAVVVDWRAMLFAFSLALITGVVFGGAAAWPSARPRLADVLRQTGRGGTGGRGRQGLIVAQAALSMVLLVGAGLLVMTFLGLRQVDPGFDPEGLVAARLPFKPAGYENAADVWALQQRVREELRGSPSVVGIVGATNLPLERGVNFPMTISGRLDAFEGAVEWRAVTPDYFDLLGVAVLEGRALGSSDLEGGPSVAVVNESFARRYFPDASALGQRIDIGRYRDEYIDPSLEGAGAEIVGVVADIREVSLRTEPRRTMYVPQAQAHSRIAAVLGTMPVFIARARSVGGDVERAITEALRAADPSLPRPDVRPMGDVVARSLARERFGATLLVVLATLALALTAFGVYSVLSYTVRQRRREIGIRMALGADRREVTRMVLRQGIGPVALGLVIGVAAAAALSRVAVGFLWGVTPTDPTTLATVATILLGVGLLASWLPAHEAVGLDPVHTLKSE